MVRRQTDKDRGRQAGRLTTCGDNIRLINLDLLGARWFNSKTGGREGGREGVPPDFTTCRYQAQSAGDYKI